MCFSEKLIMTTYFLPQICHIYVSKCQISAKMSVFKRSSHFWGFEYWNWDSYSRVSGQFWKFGDVEIDGSDW